MADVSAAPLRKLLPIPAIGLGIASGLAALVPPAPLPSVVIFGVVLFGLVCWWAFHGELRWVALLLSTALLLPPLPLAIGDSGPHPSLVFAVLGIFVGVSNLGQWRLRFDFTAISILLFLTVLLASLGPAAFYTGGNQAAHSFARVLLFGISVYVFFYVSAFGGGRTAWVIRVLYFAALLSAAFACIDFYYQLPAPAGFGPQFVWLDSGVFRRAQGFFYEASTLGNFCVFFLVMTAAALLRPGEAPVSRPLLVLGATLFGAALIFSYSRASVIAAAIGGLVILGTDRGHVRRRLAVLLLCVLGGIVLVSFAWPEFARSWQMRLEATGAQMFSATETALSGRLESWRVLTRFLAEHPWRLLLGAGYKTLPYSEVAGRPVVADNMYLSILVETGWLGLVALLLLNVAILRSAWRSRDSMLGATMLAFWCGQTVQMLSGDLLTYWRVLPVYFFVLAAMPRR